VSAGRCAIVVGHHPDSPGVRLADGSTEHDFNVAVADQLWRELQERDVSSHVFMRQVKSYTRGVLEGTVPAVNDWAADVVIGLHSNGSTSSPSGSECLHWPADIDEADRPEVTPSGSAAERELAAGISAAYARAIGIRDRGAKAQSHSWNGPQRFHESKLWRGNPLPIPGGPELYLLSRTTAPCVIGESHFMSTPADHDLALAALAAGSIAYYLAEAVAAFLRSRP
jgi:N-acetylmuramoyl-L-alanine amidase